MPYSIIVAAHIDVHASYTTYTDYNAHSKQYPEKGAHYFQRFTLVLFSSMQYFLSSVTLLNIAGQMQLFVTEILPFNKKLNKDSTIVLSWHNTFSMIITM